LVGIRVACSFYNHSHGTNYLQCSEMFAIKKFPMNMVSHEFVFVMNTNFKSYIQWIEGDDLVQVTLGFKDLYGLLSFYGVIDYIQIHIQKPKGACVIDFFPISWKVTICTCKLLSTMENIFTMSLSEC
jgi:hypothetical protein